MYFITWHIFVALSHQPIHSRGSVPKMNLPLPSLRRACSEEQEEHSLFVEHWKCHPCLLLRCKRPLSCKQCNLDGMFTKGNTLTLKLYLSFAARMPSSAVRWTHNIWTNFIINIQRIAISQEGANNVRFLNVLAAAVQNTLQGDLLTISFGSHGSLLIWCGLVPRNKHLAVIIPVPFIH